MFDSDVHLLITTSVFLRPSHVVWDKAKQVCSVLPGFPMKNHHHINTTGTYLGHTITLEWHVTQVQSAMLPLCIYLLCSVAGRLSATKIISLPNFMPSQKSYPNAMIFTQYRINFLHMPYIHKMVCENRNMTYLPAFLWMRVSSNASRLFALLHTLFPMNRTKASETPFSLLLITFYVHILIHLREIWPSMIYSKPR